MAPTPHEDVVDVIADAACMFQANLISEHLSGHWAIRLS